VKYLDDSPVALASAAPGWRVQISSEPDSECPIVAWAVVVQTYTEAGDHAVTTVEPVFVYRGVLHTIAEWREAIGGRASILVIAP
jgi:hypothetical protein